jgi:hypothetical protein
MRTCVNPLGILNLDDKLCVHCIDLNFIKSLRAYEKPTQSE